VDVLQLEDELVCSALGLQWLAFVPR
jgi:hypothetical protein